MDNLIVHYSGEIGSKGANRSFFSKKLRDNIRSSLKREQYESIGSANSRLIIKLKAQDSIKAITDSLKRFREEKYNIRIFVSNKNAGISFQEIKDAVSSRYSQESRNELYIEVLDTGCYIYSEKIQGMGGLPVGTSGKLISLISGGIDSPVAAWKMLKRGCSISFVHFYNPTQQKDSVLQKIVDLTAVLSKYQFKTKLFIVKFDTAQREIIKFVPAKYRMIIYRRFMFRIAEKILAEEGAKGFVTGDSLGQVASQTLDNINNIYNASHYAVFHPLIGEDKEAIIKMAKEIGTYNISILPYNDCCSFFVAEHPETRAELKDILDIEKSLNIPAIVDASIRQTETRVFM